MLSFIYPIEFKQDDSYPCSYHLHFQCNSKYIYEYRSAHRCWPGAEVPGTCCCAEVPNLHFPLDKQLSISMLRSADGNRAMESRTSNSGVGTFYAPESRGGYLFLRVGPWLDRAFVTKNVLNKFLTYPFLTSVESSSKLLTTPKFQPDRTWSWEMRERTVRAGSVRVFLSTSSSVLIISWERFNA